MTIFLHSADTASSAATASRAVWTPAADLGRLKSLGLGRQPGAYVLVYDGGDGRRHYYVGASGADVLGRARSHLRPRADGLVGLLLLVGAGLHYAADDAFVVERLVHQSLAMGGLTPEGRTPDGGYVAPERYAAIRVGVGRLMLDLRRGGYLPLIGPDRQIVAGPLGYRSGIDALRRPDLVDARLQCRGVDARVVIDDDGAAHLQPGSRIRRDGTPGIARTAYVQRLEAVYAGAVGMAGEVVEPMKFDSWSVLSRFVTASSAGGPGQWRMSDGAPVVTALSRRIRQTLDRLARRGDPKRRPPEDPDAGVALPGGPRHG